MAVGEYLDQSLFQFDSIIEPEIEMAPIHSESMIRIKSFSNTNKEFWDRRIFQLR